MTATYSIKIVRRHGLKLLRDARKRGRRKHVVVNLNADDIMRLYAEQQGKCALSGARLMCGQESVRQQGAMSLDRCIAGLGYELGNVQLLTRAVNNAKSTMNKQEFIAMCSQVQKHNEVPEQETPPDVNVQRE